MSAEEFGRWPTGADFRAPTSLKCTANWLVRSALTLRQEPLLSGLLAVDDTARLDPYRRLAARGRG
ncbi:hypothetical protein [Streptomyces sp. TS71-3]|uniref:hypothetical protein n=1 Tax=Streptomyces sp. TS71-3 TaxID=2733862 RepID=UPI001B1E0FBE|nr:hypothetical protein [Streptomyces sp. TS71-3]GHJ40407.1 hypothetical protein Sm713_60160 [Streptomyces sp. TS71-3]